MIAEQRDFAEALYAVAAIWKRFALSFTRYCPDTDAEFSDMLRRLPESKQMHFSIPSPAMTAPACGYEASRDRRNDVECLNCGYYLALYYVSRP